MTSPPDNVVALQAGQQRRNVLDLARDVRNAAAAAMLMAGKLRLHDAGAAARAEALGTQADGLRRACATLAGRLRENPTEPPGAA